MVHGSSVVGNLTLKVKKLSLACSVTKPIFLDLEFDLKESDLIFKGLVHCMKVSYSLERLSLFLSNFSLLLLTGKWPRPEEPVAPRCRRPLS